MTRQIIATTGILTSTLSHFGASPARAISSSDPVAKRRHAIGGRGTLAISQKAQGLFTSQQGRFAMAIRNSVARLLRQTIQAMRISRWILALAIMGGGLASLTVASHVRGAAARIEQIRRPTLPPDAKGAPAVAGRSGAQPSPPAFSDAMFRFGFLEFEDNAHAPSR
jgi:hypothetical protein